MMRSPLVVGPVARSSHFDRPKYNACAMNAKVVRGDLTDSDIVFAERAGLFRHALERQGARASLD